MATGDAQHQPTSAVPGTGDGGIAFPDALAFLNQEWNRVWSTKTSLEQRAITLITASGVLVTLAFGFAAAVTKAKSFTNFDSVERGFLLASLAFFAISALIALGVNFPRGYSTPEFDDVLGINAGKEFRRKPLERFDVALKAARKRNSKKAQLLAVGFFFQLLAIITLAVTVGIVTRPLYAKSLRCARL
jgi:hypothetical protein